MGIEISAQTVKELREKTSAGMMDCKKALQDSNGDMSKAMETLRQKGLASATKKTSRIATEGVVECYIHMGGKLGVMVEVNCETDFVARRPEFQELAKNIAMQIAASPKFWLRRRAKNGRRFCAPLASKMKRVRTELRR